ncbi:MAG: MinD/ParA family protein [Pseudomonadota bacterium]
MHSRTQADRLKAVINRAPADVIAVTSGKGGVGKTNVATNIAVALGRTHREVMLLDADLALANVDVLLDLQPRFNLSHVVNGEVDLDSTVLDGPRGIKIVPASSGNISMIDLPATARAAVINAFAGLKAQPEVLVVDTAAGLSADVIPFVTAANRAIVVVCDEPASITDAYALIKVLSRNHGVSQFDIVTNQTASEWEGRVLFAKLRRVADQYLDVVLRHLGDVPYDPLLRRAVKEQRSVVDAYPQSPAGREFMTMARSLIASRPSVTPTGGLQFFFEQLLDYDCVGLGGAR